VRPVPAAKGTCGMKRTVLSAALGIALVTGVLLAAASSGGHARASTALVRGWNNVAYLGSGAAPADALASISGQYSAVYRWNAGTQKYDLYGPGLPSYTNTLSAISAGDAIWVYLTADSGSLPSGGGSGGGSISVSSGNVSIPASAFMPLSDLAVYQKAFNQLNPVGTDEPSKRYIAPVNLPNGVSITSMTAAFEATGGDVQVRLDYTPIANGDTTAQIFKLVEVLSSAPRPRQPPPTPTR